MLLEAVAEPGLAPSAMAGDTLALLRHVSGTHLSPACGPRASHLLPSRTARAVGRDRVMPNRVLSASRSPGLGAEGDRGTGQELFSLPTFWHPC